MLTVTIEPVLRNSRSAQQAPAVGKEKENIREIKQKNWKGGRVSSAILH